MYRIRSGLTVGLALAVLLAVATRLPIRAQTQTADAKPKSSVVAAARVTPSLDRRATASVSQALTQQHRLPFRKETSLQEVAAYLHKILDAPVVLDIAALKRLSISPETTVRLELDGARLQTGLKLLLDQVGLTYRVLPEDNLLLLTDQSKDPEDPSERTLAEIKALHREVHELQDALDEVLDILAPRNNPPATKKPTLIEEVPDDKGKGVEPVMRSRNG
jgi:hypothetical protein